MEEGILPSRRDLKSQGSIEERRRLLYVSITRAKAACILSLAEQRAGAQAQAIDQRARVQLQPSRFLREVGEAMQSRTAGLSHVEVAAIFADCGNL